MSVLDHPAWCGVAFGRRWEVFSYSLNQHGFIMNLCTIPVATCFAALSMTAIAQTLPGQQQPSPEQMRAMMQATMQATMGAMTEAMGPMTEAVIEAQLSSASRPETAERIATFKRNLFDALTKKGFKPQEALQIVIATSPPTASPNAK